jgi:hypothetical protein
VFECIVCGAPTKSLAKVYGAQRDPVALCGFGCCRKFLTDPLAYVEAEALRLELPD